MNFDVSIVAMKLFSFILRLDVIDGNDNSASRLLFSGDRCRLAVNMELIGRMVTTSTML